MPGDVLALLSDGIYEYCNGENEPFGEDRVQGILRSHAGKPMSELSSALLAAVASFARGAPQDDDVTIVLVKREPRP